MKSICTLVAQSVVTLGDMPDSEAMPHDEREPLSPKQDAISLAKWQRLLTITATLLTLVAVCAIAIQLGMAIHHTLLLFALGGLFAYAIEPLVSFVEKAPLGKKGRQMGRTMSTLLVYLGLFLICAAGVWWLGDQASHQIKILQRDAPMYRARALDMAHHFDDSVLRPRGVAFSVADSIQTPPPEITTYAEGLSRQALPVIAHTLSVLTEFTVVLLIALYLLIFGPDLKERANAALSPYLRDYAIPWEDDVNRILGGFVRGQLILALINGVCAAIGLLLMGVHLWLIIGLFVVVASLIPVFGPYIAAVPALIAALVGPTHLTPVAGAIGVLILFVVINEVGGKVLYPKLVGKALNLHEVVVLFVLFAGLEIAGVVGTLLAAPIASLALVTIVHLYRLWQESPESSLADGLQNSPKSRRSKA